MIKISKGQTATLAHLQSSTDEKFYHSRFGVTDSMLTSAVLMFPLFFPPSPSLSLTHSIFHSLAPSLTPPPLSASLFLYVRLVIIFPSHLSSRCMYIFLRARARGCAYFPPLPKRIAVKRGRMSTQPCQIASA